MAKLEMGGEELFTPSLYAPNDYRQQIVFLQSLGRNFMSCTNTFRLIPSGDWNTTLNNIDKYGGSPWKESNYRNSLLIFTQELGLVDIFRAKHPD